jgi:lipoyl(octanoyl) transferase
VRHKAMTTYNTFDTSHEQWRLIVDEACDGARNMAIDEAILEAVGRGVRLPTLRLYRWKPACLSLGYAQPLSDVDFERAQDHGWHIVRRMTGGRAILHTDELTYSVALPLEHPLVRGTISDSYRRISGALMAALDNMGLQVNADKRVKGPAQAVGPVCFEVPSDYEITARGKKLIGSAQVRKHNGALQHGSLPLIGDVSRICETLVFPDDATRTEASERVLARAITLETALGKAITWEEAAMAVANAFTTTFGLTFEDQHLSPAEIDQAHELYDTRYTSKSWTHKRP